MFPDPIISIKTGGKPIEVYMYGVMIAIGILACFIVLFQYCKKFKISPKFVDFVYYNGIASILLGFVSAGLFQSLYDYIEDPSKGFHFNGGITFIGGLIGGVATFLLIYFIFRKKLDGRLYQVISIIPCCITIAHAFGRIGCFCAGCCYGKPTDSFLGIKFPHLEEKVHPTMLYESAFLFILFGVCTYLLFKHKFKHNMSVYLIGYGTFRFLNEFLRGDYRGELVAGMSPSQFWSIVMIIAGIFVYFLLDRIYKKEDLKAMQSANCCECNANCEDKSEQSSDNSSENDEITESEAEENNDKDEKSE